MSRKEENKMKTGNKHEQGWVYILTNPSFREDWVKIGKSSRPVDVRSKELDHGEYTYRSKSSICTDRVRS